MSISRTVSGRSASANGVSTILCVNDRRVSTIDTENASAVCLGHYHRIVWGQNQLSPRTRKPSLGFRTCQTQTGLYSHRIRLEAKNIGFKQKMNCTIRVAKTKALISCAVSAVLLFIPHLWISIIHFRISINYFWISINELKIFIIHLKISLNRFMDILNSAELWISKN